jgi:formate--tetrahydrofolate ligase
MADHWAHGGAGAAELAHAVARTVQAGSQGGSTGFRTLYPDGMKLWDKLRTIATEIYRAGDVTAEAGVRKRFDELDSDGFGHLPICVAKTQYSFSVDSKAVGAPSGHVLPVREVRLSAGAEFVVAVCGDIMAMPGLPKVPAANAIGLSPTGAIEGLF